VVSPALLLGAAAMLLALGLLRESASPSGLRRAWLRRGGVAVALVALGLTGALGGARDLVLLVAASPLAGWALALRGRPITKGCTVSR
jgi:hypothetical protein